MHCKSGMDLDDCFHKIPTDHFPINTGGGTVTVTHEVLVKLQALGAAKPLRAKVFEDNVSNCLSTGIMVIDEGFSFYWTHGQQPHLVTPEGKHIWLTVRNRSPVLNTRELVANKINELEAYNRINAAKSQ